MKQTRADTSIAIVQAVLLHALLFALLFAGLQWTRSKASPAAAGEPVEAELVALSELSPSMQRALARTPKAQPVPPAPKPEPLPEPLPDEVPPPARVLPPPVPEPAPVEQEKVQRDAPSPDLAKARREQEEKRRQAEQTELAAKQRQEAQRKQQALEEIRKLREQAARARQLAQQKAQQLADARGAPPATTGNRGSDNSLQAKYAAALQQAILRQWTRPETVALGQRCRLSIRQLPGGEVIDVKLSPSCPYDAQGRQSVERAVLKASPLPYAGFETVFSRTLELNFVAEDR